MNDFIFIGLKYLYSTRSIDKSDILDVKASAPSFVLPLMKEFLNIENSKNVIC